MTDVKEFYKTITDWLLPKGYTEVYSNHPCLETREFHFSKNYVRVICVKSPTETYCYLYADIMKPQFNLALTTSSLYDIGTDKLDELLKNMIFNVNLLENKKSQNIFQKIKSYFKN